MDLGDRGGGGERLEGVECWETSARLYCMREAGVGRGKKDRVGERGREGKKQHTHI